MELRTQAGRLANTHFTLIYSCLDLQATAHSCGPVRLMERPHSLLLSPSLKVASVIPNTYQSKQQMCSGKKRGKLKCRPIDKQAASLMTCTGYFLCALPLWKTKPQTNKWLEVARTDHVSVNSNDFTIKFHLNGYIPLHFFYWAFKLLGF